MATLVFVILFAGALVAYGMLRERLPDALIPGITATFFLVGLLWSLFHLDLSVIYSRRLGTAAEAALYYFNRVQRRLPGQAVHALAQHPSAVARHADLKKHLWDVDRSGPAQIAAFRVGQVTPIRDDAAIVLIEVASTSSSYYGIPVLLGGIRVTQTSYRPMAKLAVRRNDQWFLVNGLINDRIDRRLAQLLSERKQD
jgi:hypothetical protein